MGMAVRIPITSAEASSGFDRVYAIGVQRRHRRRGRRPARGAARQPPLRAPGLALVPVGTPDQQHGGRGARASAPTTTPRRATTSSGPPRRPGTGAATAPAWPPRSASTPRGSSTSRAPTGATCEEALAMSAALWPATMGFALEEMLDPLVLARLARPAEGVRARRTSPRGGCCRAFRVGPQPYGVLRDDGPPPLRAGRGGAPRGRSGRRAASAQQRFDRLLGDVLRQMGRDWERLAVDVAPRPRDEVEDVQQHFLDMLGLDATSAEQDLPLRAQRRAARASRPPACRRSTPSAARARWCRAGPSPCSSASSRSSVTRSGSARRRSWTAASVAETFWDVRRCSSTPGRTRCA